MYIRTCIHKLHKEVPVVRIQIAPQPGQTICASRLILKQPQLIKYYNVIVQAIFTK